MYPVYSNVWNKNNHSRNRDHQRIISVSGYNFPDRGSTLENKITQLGPPWRFLLRDEQQNVRKSGSDGGRAASCHAVKMVLAGKHGYTGSTRRGIPISLVSRIGRLPISPDTPGISVGHIRRTELRRSRQQCKFECDVRKHRLVKATKFR